METFARVSFAFQVVKFVLKLSEQFVEASIMRSMFDVGKL